MEVRFQSSDDRIRVNQSAETLYVETHANLDLVVPRSVPVIVEKVGGSAFIQDLDQSVVVQKVGGDLALRRIGTFRLDKVGGSCLVEENSQPSVIHKVGGDLTVRSAVTPCQVDSIGGSGDLQLLGGGGLEARAGGDLRVYFGAPFTGLVNLRAGANINAYLPESTSASFVLESGAESIDLDLKRQSQANNQNIVSRRYEFVLGESENRFEARTGGDIRVSDEEIQPEPITEELDRRENAWKNARERRGSSSWSGGFGFDRNSAWADMISRRAQEASRRAEHRAHSVSRRTEEQIRRAAEREMRHVDVRFGGPPVPPVPPVPPAPKVTEQERMMVLQMLQDNKITVEQAEALLAALEGRFEK
jgi:hypothetical protein